MRNKTARLRPMAALLLCAALALSAVPQARAAGEIKYQSHAEALAPMGVFIGTGSDFELGREPTRIEGLVVLIRLLGAESDALAMASAGIPFTDVPAWARGYAAYALENGLTQGISATLFGSSNTLEAKMFCTFLLRSLGYSDKNGDFEYIGAVEYAYAIGLLEQTQMDEIAAGIFLRDQMAKLSYDALLFSCKDGSGSLLETLVSAGKIDPGKAGDFAAAAGVTPGAQGGDADKTLVEISEQAVGVVMLECSFGTGSGVILSADGLIVTNYHVICGEEWIKVVFDDGSVYSGAVYVQDYDKQLDLAIIKIDKTGLIPVTLGRGSEMKRGERVVAIGSPLGLLNTISDGIVSGFVSVYGVEMLQTTAAISPGSSGGALFDMKGRLVGITSSVTMDGQSIGFAVPAENIAALTAQKMLTLEQFLDELISPYAPATTPTGYAEAPDVPDFGAMYGIEHDEVTNEDGVLCYVYSGISFEHANEYWDWLEEWGYIYDIHYSREMEYEGYFVNPSVFVNWSLEKIVVMDVYYSGGLLALEVLFVE